MAITFLQPGGSHTYGVSDWDLAFGTVTIDAVTVHGQPRSVKCASTYASVRKYGIITDAGFRMSCYVNITALPGDHTDGDGLIAIYSSTGLPVINFRVDESTGVLKAYDQGGATALTGGAGTIPIALNTWTRVSIAGTLVSSGVNEFRVWVNGVLDITLTNAGLDRAGADRIIFGAGTSTTSFFSDIYVDDSAALTDPGDIRVTAKLPASNSTNAWNTAIGASPSNRWENVNERPLSETNGWEETALTAVEESYGIQAAADTTGGSSDISTATIIGHGAWIWAKAGTGGLGTPQLIRNGTDVPVTLTASPAYYVAYAASATYPSGVVGMKSAGVTDTTFLYETGMLIAYTPSGGAAPAGSGVAGSSGVYSPRAITQPVASGWA